MKDRRPQFPVVVSFEGEHPKMLIGTPKETYPRIASEQEDGADTQTWD